ncbi:ATP-binding protein [Ekhidna sp. To15]|uniref:ATP-binding protein n=1 Tax=Ekhidna sp. To15 TaxID=3395267 RepID=UPI003F51CB10
MTRLKKHCTYIILFISTLSGFSQDLELKADSIIESITTNLETRKQQVDSLNLSASKYLKVKSTITWILAAKALEIAKDIGYQEGEAVANYYLGTSQAYKKYDIAIAYLNESKRLAYEIGDLSLQANALLSISGVYHGMTQYGKAIDATKEAEQLGKLISDEKILSRVYTNLATYYYDADDASMALKYSRIAIERKEKLNDSYGLRLNYLNLGVILSEYDSTIDEGIRYMQKSRSLSKDDPIMVNDVMANMIWAHLRKKYFKECLVYLDSAMIGNDTIDNKYTRQAIHRLGKEVYLEIGDFENAFKYAQLEYELEKELRGKEIEGRFKVLELENENNENQKQILLLEKKRSEANLKFLYTAILAALLLLLLAVLFKSDRLKKKLLDDLRLKQLVIEDKSNLLEIKNKEIEQFAYVAGHDLKAPLNTIISCINIVKDEIDSKLSDQPRQMANFIMSSANRMKSMIDSLLEHGRLGKELVFEEVDLNSLIDDLKQDIHHLIQESGAILDINYLPTVKGSRVELSLLFQNLITNGIKFSRNNQVPKIAISYRSHKNTRRYEFSIKDNGIGIPERNRGKIFNLFERAHGNSYEGSGIGLAHCKKIVELHKGSIWFDSTEGAGTTFHFLLPMKDWSNMDSPQNGNHDQIDGIPNKGPIEI